METLSFLSLLSEQNTIMMGDNMIIIAVMITFVDWMLHWSLLPAVTKMAEEPLSQNNE